MQTVPDGLKWAAHIRLKSLFGCRLIYVLKTLLVVTSTHPLYGLVRTLWAMFPAVPQSTPPRIGLKLGSFRFTTPVCR